MTRNISYYYFSFYRSNFSKLLEKKCNKKLGRKLEIYGVYYLHYIDQTTNLDDCNNKQVLLPITYKC